MMNMYIAKMMSCDDNKNEDECVENEHANECVQQMQWSILNKYEDERDIYICNQNWNQIQEIKHVMK